MGCRLTLRACDTFKLQELPPRRLYWLLEFIEGDSVMSWLMSCRTAKNPAAPTAPAAAFAAACLYRFFFVSSTAAKAPPSAIKAQRVISANKAYLANTDNVASHAVLLARAERLIELIVRTTLIRPNDFITHRLLAMATMLVVSSLSCRSCRRFLSNCSS